MDSDFILPLLEAPSSISYVARVGSSVGFLSRAGSSLGIYLGLVFLVLHPQGRCGLIHVKRRPTAAPPADTKKGAIKKSSNTIVRCAQSSRYDALFNKRVNG